jgi:hypothetical protein
MRIGVSSMVMAYPDRWYAARAIIDPTRNPDGKVILYG